MIQRELLGTRPLRKNVTQARLDEWLHYYNHYRLYLEIELQTLIEVATQPAARPVVLRRCWLENLQAILYLQISSCTFNGYVLRV